MHKARFEDVTELTSQLESYMKRDKQNVVNVQWVTGRHTVECVLKIGETTLNLSIADRHSDEGRFEILLITTTVVMLSCIAEAVVGWVPIATMYHETYEYLKSRYLRRYVHPAIAIDQLVSSIGPSYWPVHYRSNSEIIVQFITQETAATIVSPSKPPRNSYAILTKEQFAAHITQLQNEVPDFKLDEFMDKPGNPLSPVFYDVVPPKGVSIEEFYTLLKDTLQVEISTVYGSYTTQSTTGSFKAPISSRQNLEYYPQLPYEYQNNPGTIFVVVNEDLSIKEFIFVAVANNDMLRRNYFGSLTPKKDAVIQPDNPAFEAVGNNTPLTEEELEAIFKITDGISKRERHRGFDPYPELDC